VAKCFDPAALFACPPLAGSSSLVGAALPSVLAIHFLRSLVQKSAIN